MFDAIGLKTHYHAKGDGSTDDHASIVDWLDEGMETGRPLYIEAGHYKSLKAITVQLAKAREDGVRILGAGRGRSVFELAEVSDDVPFWVRCDACDDGLAKEDDNFLLEMEGFGVVGKIDGPVVRFGKDDYSDALNSIYFTKVKVDNALGHKDARAVELNYVLQSVFDIKANCHGRPDKNNKGVALALRHAAFCSFYGSYANADIGVLLEADDSFANGFYSLDFEEGKTAIAIRTDKAINNTFYTPQIAFKDGLDFSAGNNNVVDNPNDALRTERYDRKGNVTGYARGKFVINDIGLVRRSWSNSAGRPPVRKLPPPALAA